MSGQFVPLKLHKSPSLRQKLRGNNGQLPPVCFVTVQVHTSQGALRAFFGLRKLEQKLKRSGRTPGGVSFCFPLHCYNRSQPSHRDSNKSRVLTSLHSGSLITCHDGVVGIVNVGLSWEEQDPKVTACAIKVQQNPIIAFCMCECIVLTLMLFLTCMKVDLSLSDLEQQEGQ